jgi:hypothetical protein
MRDMVFGEESKVNIDQPMDGTLWVGRRTGADA